MSAKFVKTATAIQEFPNWRFKEVALVGRSNVGKSSLLSHLLRSKGLARTSKTPGKTQAINFFLLNDLIAFADLPGYGYAKVPKGMKKAWGQMIQDYLQTRENLKLLLLLLDIRRIPGEEDLQMVQWASFFHKPLVIVLTKTDKLSKNEVALQTKTILQEIGREICYIPYTIYNDLGRDALMAMIDES